MTRNKMFLQYYAGIIQSRALMRTMLSTLHYYSSVGGIMYTTQPILLRTVLSIPLYIITS